MQSTYHILYYWPVPFILHASLPSSPPPPLHYPFLSSPTLIHPLPPLPRQMHAGLGKTRGSSQSSGETSCYLAAVAAIRCHVSLYYRPCSKLPDLCNACIAGSRTQGFVYVGVMCSQWPNVEQEGSVLFLPVAQAHPSLLPPLPVACNSQQRKSVAVPPALCHPPT